MKNLMLLICITLIFCVSGFSQEAKSEKGAFSYVGLKKCKICHKGEKRGQQFEILEKQKHSQAYHTLAGEEAKKIAKEMGIEDPQKAKECLVCHVTAFDAPADQKVDVTLEEGISCEACHGPGSEYKSMKVMKDIYAGTVKGCEYGLIEPNAKLCITCHNEKSPTYKKFDYAVEVKKIAHPVPAATK